MTTPPTNRPTADPAAALAYAHPQTRSMAAWLIRTLLAFFAATFVTDAIILAIDGSRAHDGPPPNPFLLRLLFHGLFDLLALTILWFAISTRGRKMRIESRSWYVAAIAGVIFAVLLYGPSLITFDRPRVTDPSNLEGGQTGASWPVLVYFLYPLGAAVIITRKRKDDDAA